MKYERTSEYTVRDGRVLKGHTIIAYTFRRRDGGLNVATPNGRSLGRADSPAHAMLMAARDQTGEDHAR